MKNLTLIIPAKNESESLPKVLEEIRDYECSIIVILESSDIETINATKDFNCKIVHQSEKGYGNALIEGINKINTKFFCIINADGSMNPTEISAMMRLTKSNSFIFGSRYIKNGGSEDDTIITYIGNKFFSLIGNIFFKLKITDILYTYVIGETNLAKKLKLKSGDFKICVELPIKVHRKKISYTDFACYESKRIGGKKKVNAFKDGFLILVKMFQLFFDGFFNKT